MLCVNCSVRVLSTPDFNSIKLQERKQLEKEARRLWQQLEVKEGVLEETALRLASLEKEGITKEKELERLKEVTGKVKELERENKELQKQATIDKRTLVTLREVCMGKV